MSAGDSNEITQYLQRLEAGDSSAYGKLLPLVYEDLRRLAGDMFRRQDAAQTLQPTALVHEAFLRLAKPGDGGFASRRHFLDVAAMAMRQILIDHARSRKAAKRGAGRPALLLEQAAAETPAHESQRPATLIDVLSLDAALTELEAIEPQQARVVHLRFFGGLSVDEIATHLDINARTVSRKWRAARAWLRRRIDSIDSMEEH